MPLEIRRSARPRLYRAADDPGYRFPAPRDALRRRILDNILADCEAWAGCRPWRRIPERPDSPHPFHQLYITFYCGMQATALIEHYAFAWRLTGQGRWLEQARAWLLAAAGWEHGDRVEEHFYTANRYMHAFAVALDLLCGQLSARQEERVTRALVALMERWWPEVERARRAPEGGHHAVVDNGHFGIAALCLLGVHPDAERWVEAVVERFRCAIMPHGCGPQGEPVDGPTFWAWENLWMAQFVDALRNVTGIDLAAEFPERLSRPLTWIRYHLAAPGRIADAAYYPPNSNVLAGSQLDACAPVLLRLAPQRGAADLRRVAQSDPRLGRIYSFAAGVKGSPAECILAGGPYAYLWCGSAPPPARRGRTPVARRFAARYGESAVLRAAWEAPAPVACVTGYGGGTAHSFSHLHLQWAGHPVLRAISCREARPLAGGSQPCVGGEGEIVSFLGRLQVDGVRQRLAVRSRRLEQEYWLLPGPAPALVAAVRRRPRRLQVLQEDGLAFVRLLDHEWLQYARPAAFSPQAGQVRLRVRLLGPVDRQRPQVLFSVGHGVAGLMGTQVNVMSLGFLEEGVLAFAVQSQGAHRVVVPLPGAAGAMRPGQWHDVGAAWGGLGDPQGRPFIEVELDGRRQRLDQQARFGEVGAGLHGLERTRPRTFRLDPNTGLSFGAAGQMPDTGADCDLARIEVSAPGRRPVALTFPQGLETETGGGALGWKVNPVDLRHAGRQRARLGAGRQSVALVALYPQDVRITTERVPFATAGLAGESLRSLVPGAGQPAVRLRVEAGPAQDCLVLAFAQGRAAPAADGVLLGPGAVEQALRVNPRPGGPILSLR